MVKLQLDIALSNLNKVKASVQSAFENVQGKKGAAGGAGALAIGGAVAVLTKLLSSVDSVVKLLEIIGGLINMLVAPFVPILLGLIKPVFVLLQKYLFGAMQKLGVEGFGGDEQIGFGEKMTKMILGTLAGALSVVAATIAGATVGWALAIGAAIFLLVPHLVDFGKSLGTWLINLGVKLGEWMERMGSKLADVILWLGDIFSDAWGWLSATLSDAWEGLKNTLASAWELLSEFGTWIWDGLVGIFSGIFSTLSEIFINVVSSLWDILKGAWNGIKDIWEWLLSTLKSGIQSFANLFIKGLNFLIEILNKVPGVDIGQVRGVGSSNVQTSINVVVQGNTNEDTVDQMLRALRREQQKRGTGSF